MIFCIVFDNGNYIIKIDNVASFLILFDFFNFISIEILISINCL